MDKGEKRTLGIEYQCPNCKEWDTIDDDIEDMISVPYQDYKTYVKCAFCGSTTIIPYGLSYKFETYKDHNASHSTSLNDLVHNDKAVVAVYSVKVEFYENAENTKTINLRARRK